MSSSLACLFFFLPFMSRLNLPCLSSKINKSIYLALSYFLWIPLPWSLKQETCSPLFIYFVVGLRDLFNNKFIEFLLYLAIHNLKMSWTNLPMLKIYFSDKFLSDWYSGIYSSMIFGKVKNFSNSEAFYVRNHFKLYLISRDELKNQTGNIVLSPQSRTWIKSGLTCSADGGYTFPEIFNTL